MKPFESNENIRVSKSERAPGFKMNALEVYQDYYGVGYRITGDSIIHSFDNSRLITDGNIILIDKDLYHRATYNSACKVTGMRVQFTLKEYDKLEKSFGKDNLAQIFSQVAVTVSKSGQERIIKLMEIMLEEYESKRDNYQVALEYFLNLFFMEIFRSQVNENFMGKQLTDMYSKLPEKSQGIIKAVDYVDRHFREDPSIELVAKQISVTPTYLSKLFRRIIGISYSSYLTKAKINCASRLLKHTKFPVTEVALQSGFSSHNYFCYVFRKEMGCTPMEYRAHSSLQV